VALRSLIFVARPVVPSCEIDRIQFPANASGKMLICDLNEVQSLLKYDEIQETMTSILLRKRGGAQLCSLIRSIGSKVVSFFAKGK